MEKMTRMFVSAALACRQKKLALRVMRRLHERRHRIVAGDGFELLVELGEEALERGDVVGAVGYFEWVLDRKPECARSMRGMAQLAKCAA